MNDTRPMAFISQPGRIEFREVPLPPLGPHDVLVDVRAVTLCGSDLHLFKGKHPAVSLPVPVGHEISGQVSEIGEAVSRLAPGDRVAVEPVITCETCDYCLQGAYHLCENISFQYRTGQGGLTPKFIVAERWAHKLPADLSFAEGAMLEPLSVAVHAVRKAGLAPGESAAVFGDGPIGLLILALLKRFGIRPYLAGMSSTRLAFAQQFGAEAVFHNGRHDSVGQIREMTAGKGVNASFEAVGLETTLRQSLQVLKKGGHAIVVGLFEQTLVELPANLFIQNEISLTGSQGYHWDFQRAISLLEERRIELQPFLTHRFALKDTQRAFDFLLEPGNDVVKAVIEI